jgi:putative FmdB family regulatory protein
MPIYEYRCDCGAIAEVLAALSAPAPACQACGSETQKAVSRFVLTGRADAGLSQPQMPQTWKGTYGGNAEYTTVLLRQWERRRSLEDRNPELAGDCRPIVAHEGHYSAVPLRAGEPGASTIAHDSEPAADESGQGIVGGGHHHAHSHGHAHTRSARPQPPAA